MCFNSPGSCSSHLPELQNTITSLKKLYDYGLFLEKLSHLLPLVDIIDIRSFLKFNLHHLEKISSTQESLHLNNLKILKDKSTLSNINITITKLSKILDLDLTLKEKDLSPLWNKSFKELSNKLLLPILTDLHVLDSNSLKSYVNTSIQNLPFSQIKKINPLKKNSLRTSSPSLPITPQNSTECVNITYCRKIRIYPCKEQRSYFEKCFGATRYLYNKTIHYFNNLPEGKKMSCSLAKIRPLIMKNNSQLLPNDSEYWMTEIPYDTRQLAIKSALSGVKGCFEQIKKKLIDKFKMSFKTKRNPKQIFHIDHRAVKNMTLFPSVLKDKCKLEVKNRYKNYYDYTPESDCIIQRHNNKYYILISKTKSVERVKKPNKIISLDPGIRTFQSFYTPEGYVGDLGNQKYKEELLKRELNIDKLKSLISKEKNKRKIKKWKRRCCEWKNKVCNIVRDFQWKVSSFLCKNYETIFLPEFESKNMIKGLCPLNRRILNLQSHYKFQMKMKYQGKKYGSNVKIVNESYTTKTCGNCGRLNDIGTSKIYNCVNCKLLLERDYHAARNILIKNLTSKGSDRDLKKNRKKAS